MRRHDSGRGAHGYPSTNPCTHAPIHLCTHPSNHLSIHPSTHPPTHPPRPTCTRSSPTHGVRRCSVTMRWSSSRPGRAARTQSWQLPNLSSHLSRHLSSQLSSHLSCHLSSHLSSQLCLATCLTFSPSPTGPAAQHGAAARPARGDGGATKAAGAAELELAEALLLLHCAGRQSRQSRPWAQDRAAVQGSALRGGSRHARQTARRGRVAAARRLGACGPLCRGRGARRGCARRGCRSMCTACAPMHVHCRVCPLQRTCAV